MVSSVQRTEVADVASLFIGCDMKKRSACKILSGIVALGVIDDGHCGRIELQGPQYSTAYYSVEVSGINPDSADTVYDIGVGCAAALGYHGPGLNVSPRDIRIVSRGNAANVTVSRGTGYAGYAVRWSASRPDEPNFIKFDFLCDNRDKPEWTWVNVGFHRDRRYPKSDLLVTATNYTLGVTETHEWIRSANSAWYPSWGAVHADNSPDGPATASVSYPEQVELRGKRSSARILYDVVGSVPVTVRIDKMPQGLSCARTPDGTRIESGVTADVGTRNSITCTNVRAGKGSTTDTLSVTAMIR